MYNSQDTLFTKNVTFIYCISNSYFDGLVGSHWLSKSLRSIIERGLVEKCIFILTQRNTYKFPQVQESLVIHPIHVI